MLSSTHITSKRAVYKARVLGKRQVAPAHYQLKLQAPDLCRQLLPGQFVHVLTTPNSDQWEYDPLLRRAFSIMSVEEREQQNFDLLFRVEGRGTKMLSTVRIDDKIDLIGPLGKPFDTSLFENVEHDNSEFHVKQNPAVSALLVGGGVGVPPLVYLGQMLHRSGVAVHAIIGARSKAEAICGEELNLVCERVSVTTDDGSHGHKGRVTDLLPQLIGSLIEMNGSLPVIYSCGPMPMLRAVASICAQMGVKCQVSLEENMPCGIGVCNGCVVRARQPFAAEKARPQNKRDLNEVVGNEWSPYQAYRRVCVEGPACWADEIDWEHNHD